MSWREALRYVKRDHGGVAGWWHAREERHPQAMQAMQATRRLYERKGWRLVRHE